MKKFLILLLSICFIGEMTAAPPAKASSFLKAAGWVAAGIAAYKIGSAIGDHIRASRAARNSTVIVVESSGNGGSPLYESDNGAEQAEIDRVYAEYVKIWNRDREQDVAQIRKAREALSQKLASNLEGVRQNWYCQALCGQDVEDTTIDPEVRADYKVFHYKVTPVMSASEDLATAYEHLDRRCRALGARSGLLADARVVKQKGTDNLQILQSYAGNACIPTRDFENAGDGFGTDKNKTSRNYIDRALNGQGPKIKTVVVDAWVDAKPGEKISAQWLREFYTEVKADYNISDVGASAAKELKVNNSSSLLDAINKEFKIDAHASASGHIVLRSKTTSDTVTLTQKTVGNGIQDADLELNSTFTVEHDCRSETHKFVVRMASVPASTPTRLFPPSARWSQAQASISQLALVSDDYCGGAENSQTLGTVKGEGRTSGMAGNLAR